MKEIKYIEYKSKMKCEVIMKTITKKCCIAISVAGFYCSSRAQTNTDFAGFLSDQQIMPKSGPNSCYIDPELADDPDMFRKSLWLPNASTF